jgi:hypothetical protein
MIFPEDEAREKKIKNILTRKMCQYELYEKWVINEIFKYDYTAKCKCGSNVIILRYGTPHCSKCFDYYISPKQRKEMIQNTYFAMRRLTMLFVILLVITYTIKYLAVVFLFIYTIMMIVLWATTLYL